MGMPSFAEIMVSVFLDALLLPLTSCFPSIVHFGSRTNMKHHERRLENDL